jgi:Flp pilus assembly protein CpaB
MIDAAPSRREQRRQAKGPQRGAAGPVGVRVAGGQRQRQLPWVALGVLLVVMSMLGFALWSIQQAQRTPVLVAGREIDAGSVIERDDLELVSVGADAGLSVIDAGQEDLVIGATARGPIPAGTPLSPALVVPAAEAVPAGSAVVGAMLEAGEYPTSALQPGDRVKLIETAPAGPAVERDQVVELAEATVWTGEPLDGSSRRELFVSLLVVETSAARVSSAAAAEQLRLVLVGSAR